MADILYYAALDKYLFQDTQLAAATDQKNRANTTLNARKATLAACVTCANCCLCCSNVAEAARLQRKLDLETLYCINAQIQLQPTNVDNWEKIYDGRTFPSSNCTSYDGFFCVGDFSACARDPQDQAGLNSCCCSIGYSTGGLYRCGGCYLWTVPAGVCCVEMEIWGSGAWTTGGCCCGGSPFGMSGSFVFANMTVLPGETICFCAGCAACCTCACSNGASSMQSSASTVIGNGFNFCAPGATTWFQNQTTNSYSYGGYCIYRVASPQCIGQSGGCWCNSGQNWCMQSCASCGVIPMTPGMGWPKVCYNAATRLSSLGAGHQAWIATIPSMHGCWCYDANNYGYYMSPPIPGFVDYSQCCLSHSSGSCHGCNCCAGTGFNAYPGQGGTRSHAMGGTTNCKGDNGRTGWIRVRYCCV